MGDQDDAAADNDESGVEAVEGGSFFDFVVDASFEAEAFADDVGGGEREDRGGEKRSVEQAEGEEVGGPLPASGARAAAAWAASVILVMPFLFSVAAQQTMMKKTMTMQEMLPTRTSRRACLYCLGPTRFSTKPACR